MVPTCAISVPHYIELLEKSLFLSAQPITDQTYSLKDDVRSAWECESWYGVGEVQARLEMIRNVVSSGYTPSTVSIPLTVLSNVVDLIKDNATLLRKYA